MKTILPFLSSTKLRALPLNMVLLTLELLAPDPPDKVSNPLDKDRVLLRNTEHLTPDPQAPDLQLKVSSHLVKAKAPPPSTVQLMLLLLELLDNQTASASLPANLRVLHRHSALLMLVSQAPGLLPKDSSPLLKAKAHLLLTVAPTWLDLDLSHPAHQTLLLNLRAPPRNMELLVLYLQALPVVRDSNSLQTNTTNPQTVLANLLRLLPAKVSSAKTLLLLVDLKVVMMDTTTTGLRLTRSSPAVRADQAKTMDSVLRLELLLSSLDLSNTTVPKTSLLDSDLHLTVKERLPLVNNLEGPVLRHKDLLELLLNHRLDLLDLLPLLVRALLDRLLLLDRALSDLLLLDKDSDLLHQLALSDRLDLRHRVLLDLLELLDSPCLCNQRLTHTTALDLKVLSLKDLSSPVDSLRDQAALVLPPSTSLSLARNSVDLVSRQASVSKKDTSTKPKLMILPSKIHDLL